MKSQILALLGLILAFTVTGIASGQDCGCGSTVEGGHRHFWPGPYGGPNCGRDYNQSQAEALWAGYCTENCSLCGRGCGGACGLAGRGVGGPFGACARVGSGHLSSGGKLLGNAGELPGQLFARQGNGVSCGQEVDCGTPVEIGGKACGRSLFGCSQWGWGDCGSGCGSGNCNAGSSRGGCEHLRHVGRAGRYFQPAGCDGGCDQGSANVVPPHAAAQPTSFHRYHSGQRQPTEVFSDLPPENEAALLSGFSGN